jgi:ligand-binding sensor domain-containing protein
LDKTKETKIMMRLLYACVLVLCNILSFSQEDILFEYSQALPVDNTKAILEVESLNEIWVGTYLGIARYDGANWTQESNLGGAADLNAYDMIEADDGTVWVALGGGGVSKYDGGIWTNYTDADGLCSNSIWAIAEDLDGNIWAGSTDAGVSVFDGISWNTYTVSDGIVGNAVVEILVTKLGDVWLGTANGVSVWDGVSFTNLTLNEGMPSNLVRDLYQDFNGNICVGSSNGIGMYNGADWTYLTTDDGLQTNNILQITQMQNGDFLFATNIGMIHYDGTNFTLLDYDNGIASDIVRGITVVSNGDIWLSTPFHGISIVDTENVFNNIRTNLNLVNDEINVLDAVGNTLWVGTNEGANSFNGEIWRTFNTQDGLIGDTVVDIVVKGTKTYFACRGGLSIYEDQNYDEYTMAEGLLSDTINAVEVLADGTIYLGTYDGLMEIQTDASMTNYIVLDGLANDTVYDLITDASGDLWIGTKNGLSHFSGGVFTNYDETNLGGSDVRALYIDQNNDLWAATENSLAKYVAGAWTFYNYPIGNQPVVKIQEYDDNIYFLTEGAGTIWTFNTTTTTFVETTIVDKHDFAILTKSYLYYGANAGVEGEFLFAEDRNAINTTNTSCPEIANGQIEIIETTDNPPYFYSIDNAESFDPSNTFTGLEAGQYHIKVLNGLGQFTQDTTVFIRYDDFVDAVIDLEQIDCFGENNGLVQVFSGETSYTITWADSPVTDALRENLTPNTYSVTVSNVSCDVTRHNQIVAPEQISLSATTVDVDCFGDNTGSIDVTVTGGTLPYEFMWADAEEAEDRLDLIAGDYTVTLTDANGCTAELSETISQPAAALAVSETIQNVQCSGDETGEILLDISGGTIPYDIIWNDGVTDEDRLNIPDGDYDVTITDDNGCSITESYTVAAPNALEFTLVTYDDVLCAGAENGSINVTTQGGTGTHTYEWTMEGEAGVYSTEQNIEALAAGEYTLVVTDENSCQIDSTVTIAEPSELSLNFDLTPITCQGYDDAIIEALPSGGTTPYIQYYWSYSDNPNIIGVNAELPDCQPGWYHITVTDAHYCEIIDSIEVINPPEHTVELIVTDMPCHGSETGQIEVVVDGGSTTDLSYAWSNAVGDVAIAIGLGADEYTVTITDATNCELVESAEVDEPALGELGAFDESGIIRMCQGSFTSLDAGSGFVSYLWSTGSNEQSIEVETEDTYTVFVVDTDDCEYGDTVEVELSYPYNNEEICFATVDEDNHVNLLWNKTPNVGTASYNIYRKNPATDDYDLIGNQLYSLPALFVDDDTNAAEMDQDYKLSVVDTCGNESAMSEMHSNISLYVNADVNGGCTLNWDSYEGYFVVYYFIMRGTTQDNMQVVDSVLYTDFDFAQMNPDANGVYYQIMVKRPDFCTPGDGTEYGFAYSNIVYCDNLNGMAQMAYGGIDVYPNPFDHAISVDLMLKIQSDIHLKLYNSMGQLIVDTLYSDVPAGDHQLNLQNLNVVPGLYNLQLHFGDQVWQQHVVSY